jgi:cysteine synthase A
MKQTGILSAIGNTPLIQLTRVIKEPELRIFAKMESLNPGGSMKDRAARTIIENGIQKGLINSNTVIIESSSGNMGIGLALVCRWYGLRFICVIDPKTTMQNTHLLELYGAEIDVVTQPHALSGDFLQARLDRVRYLLTAVENSFWPNQYANLDNARAHYDTAREILEALDERPDYLFCATSTCGTLRGCAEFFSLHSPTTKIVAVDAVGSVIFGGPKSPRLIPGHGAAVRPDLYRSDLAAISVHITDMECVIGCRRLMAEEAILAGGSSGAILMALEKIRNDFSPGALCVLILADRGDRYLDTIYSDSWVSKHLDCLEELRSVAEDGSGMTHPRETCQHANGSRVPAIDRQ